MESGSTGALSQAEQLQQLQPKVPLFEPAPVATESQWGSSGNVLDSFVSASGAKREWQDEEQKAARARHTPVATAAAAAAVWDETQVQEDEKTWDRFGDMDYGAGPSSSASSRPKSNKRRKR